MEEESKTKFSMNVEFSFAFKNFLKNLKKLLAKSDVIRYTKRDVT